MELPHGVLVRNFKGPVPLHELNLALLKDSFTGFMRASLVNGALIEGILVYSAGKPIISFSSDGKADRPDNEQKVITSVMANDDAIIELFSLNEGQVRLAMDFCRDYVIRFQPPPPPAPPQPVKEAPKPMPVQKPKFIREEKPLGLPEVRGTFARSENVDNLRSYINGSSDGTGHAIFLRQDGAAYAEYHLLFLNNIAVGAYSASSKESGTYLLSQILPAAGMLEFYRVDESIIHSILKMYPHVAAVVEDQPEPVAIKPEPQAPAEARHEPGPMEILRPDGRSYGMPPSPKSSRPEPLGRAEAAAHGTVTRPPGKPEYVPRTEIAKPVEAIKQDTPSRQAMGIPARSLFEKNDRQAYSVEGALGTPAPESRSTGTLKGDMDDDADFVKKVEKEFVGNVDDLLKRLELSHLKVVPEKKKRQ